jgi:dipeptidyl aminopeptidase/acylaminoacyl peptidase
MAIASYGAWQSPITSDLIVSDAIGISGVRSHQDVLYWLESRPQEAGRSTVVARQADGRETDLIPAPFNVRSRVHEYGGDAWLIHDGSVYFVNFADQQVYRQDTAQSTPQQLTAAPALRFANGVVDAERRRIVYVVEDHSADGEARNYLASVSLSNGEITILAQGHDFYSSPELDPSGARLAWLTWDHPDMPWDETTLWQADIRENGALGEPKIVAGGPGKSHAVQQPRYAPDGTLYYISDEQGWWNIYTGQRCICPQQAEFGLPHWGFGLSTYQFLDSETVACLYSEKNQSRLAILNTASGDLQTIEQPYSDIGGIHASGRVLTYVAASPTRFATAIIHDLDSGEQRSIKQTVSPDLDSEEFSIPQTMVFPTADGEDAHAFFYAPRNKNFQAPDNELPPLIVLMHGGPTGATHNALSLKTQFWTNRGFAILDINYRGSSGYGRRYRDKLRLQWGIADVADTVAGTDYLVQQQLVDPQKLAIKGGSAGGYTVLAALTFEDTFKAGASHYGIGDLETLARDTHKFESRYLDSMIGRYPQDIDVYKARSPVNHASQLSAAVIFFQGLEDQVVPPNQAEDMVQILKDKGMPVAYVPFEGEQHGFRRAENITRALELELYFYGRVFDFVPADSIEPIAIHNLDSDQSP